MPTFNKIIMLFGLILLTQVTFAQYKLYEDGVNKYKTKDYDACIDKLTEFLSKSTRDKKFDVDAHYYRALSYFKKDNHKHAVEDFEEAALLNHPNKGNVYWFMAKSHEKLGFYNDAIDNYGNAIRELGADRHVKAKLLYERSLIHAKVGNTALAQDDIVNGYTAHQGNEDLKREYDKLGKEAVSRATESHKPQATEEQKVSEKKETEVAKKDDKIEPKKDAVVPVVEPVNTQPTLSDIYKEEKRYALVIGNSAYPKTLGVLKNPVNDATDVAEELRKSNFEVLLLTDATYGQMRASMLKFKEKVDAGERDKTVALFYYAGHGLQHEDENYLVPIDAMVEYEDDIARYCFAVQRMVLANMERSNSRMNIVILDACRNNPFPALTRSAGQAGLGEMKRARGSFIAYATAPGSVASDGSGRNGLYTQELLKAMRKPGLTIEQVFKEVRINVLRMSGDKQNTWDSSNIIGDFYFKF
ncbi:MAG: caspase family protein [Bacteroidota bacterium]